MKLKRLMRGYFREQIKAVNITGGVYAMPVSNGRGTGSLMLSVIFHTVLILMILTAMISRRYQTSHLEQQIFQVTERYSLEDRLVNSLESLIQVIKNNKSAGGKL